MQRFIKKFFLNEVGAAAPIIALTFASIVAAAGAATDYARAQMVQAKLADTLDAAGLAAGATLSTHEPKTMAQNYFNVNFPSAFMHSNATLQTVTENATGTMLTLHATASVPTVFMQMMGIDHIDVSADTEITRKSGGLELILVMDNTGSMAGSKLTNLKNSASTLVKILFGDDATKDDLWIGLVPFAQAVNITPQRTTWVNSSYTALDWGPTSWAGCVDARSGVSEESDDPPSVKKFDAYYWADDDNYNNWKTSTTKKGKTTITYANGIGPDLGPNKYCSQSVQIMSNNKSTVLAGIQTMQARGNTHVNLGAVWGWRMISPRWRGLWGGTMNANGLPLDYSTDNMTKAVVIMTDGENTMSNSVRTAYGYLSENKLGTTNANTAVTKLNTKLTSVCNSMKSHAIKVYTVLYDLNDNNVATLMKGCASQTDYFFNSPTGTELESAFKQIGDSLSNLRISK